MSDHFPLGICINLSLTPKILLPGQINTKKFNKIAQLIYDDEVKANTIQTTLNTAINGNKGPQCLANETNRLIEKYNLLAHLNPKNKRKPPVPFSPTLRALQKKEKQT